MFKEINQRDDRVYIHNLLSWDSTYILCLIVISIFLLVLHHDSPGGVWLYCAINALLTDLPTELTACTAMLVYTLFLSSPVKL